MQGDNQKGYEGWTILELLGHRRLGGFCREVEVAGAPMLRIDVPAPPESADAILATQFYSPAAIYCITPASEAAARAVAARNRPEPVHYFELPSPRAAAGHDDYPDDDDTD